MISPAASKLVGELQLPSAVLGLEIAPDGGLLHAACLDGGVWEVDPVTGASERIAGHRSYASGVARPGTGDLLVSAGYDGVLQWHRPRERKTLRSVQAHGFWSWQLAASPARGLVASATGQYLCGGYRYEPTPEREPSVKVFDAEGKEILALPHVPPVQSVAFSPDGAHLAAGNLLGEVRIWEVPSGKEVARIATGDFTGWGIIKGHYFTGGIFALAFSPDGAQLLAAGMGSTTDPAAGNGRQLWQRYLWSESGGPRKLDETRPGQSGEGLMETLAFHPSGAFFVMAGRLFKGNWNVAFFDAKSGEALGNLSTKSRVTRAVFSPDGTRLYLAAAVGQSRAIEGAPAPFGRIHVVAIPGGERRY